MSSADPALDVIVEDLIPQCACPASSVRDCPLHPSGQAVTCRSGHSAGSRQGRLRVCLLRNE
jgi:hypothetical protein